MMLAADFVFIAFIQIDRLEDFAVAIRHFRQHLPHSLLDLIDKHYMLEINGAVGHIESILIDGFVGSVNVLNPSPIISSLVPELEETSG